MKKLLLFVALTAAISFCASTFDSFASSNDSTVTAEGVYWQGMAYAHDGYVYITVYQISGQCNAYEAYVSKWQHKAPGGSVTVDITNEPSYVVKYSERKKQYYITFRDMDYYFNM